jgi:hypothetical protein
MAQSNIGIVLCIYDHQSGISAKLNISSARHNQKQVCYFQAGNAIRTRDINLGKVALYH